MLRCCNSIEPTRRALVRLCAAGLQMRAAVWAGVEAPRRRTGIHAFRHRGDHRRSTASLPPAARCSLAKDSGVEPTDECQFRAPIGTRTSEIRARRGTVTGAALAEAAPTDAAIGGDDLGFLSGGMAAVPWVVWRGRPRDWLPDRSDAVDSGIQSRSSKCWIMMEDRLRSGVGLGGSWVGRRAGGGV